MIPKNAMMDILLNHYLNNDMSVSGMSDDDYEKFFSRM